ncbi:MAG: beta-propeller fold lactonase family protein [Candidatus Tumulicola sp.]
MRLSIAAANRAALVLLAAMLAGCSNTPPDSRALPVGSSGASRAIAHPGGRVPEGSVQFAYVANFGSNDVSAFSVDATSGALTPVAGSPFKAGTAPYGIAIDATGEFAYVANLGSNNVSAYVIDATSGALKKVKGSPFATGTNPLSVAVDQTGKFAYVANNGSKNVSAYAIDATSGALTPVNGSPFKAGLRPYAVAVDPSSKFAYVVNVDSNNVSAYTIDVASGALTPVKGSPFSTGISPVGVTVHPSGKFVYVATYGSDNLDGYAIDAATGALRPLEGSPFADPDSGPAGVVVVPGGGVAYVPDSAEFGRSDSFVAAYSIDTTRGTLTPIAGSPFKNPGTAPISGAVDPTSKFAYVTNFSSDDVSVYTIATDGALRKVKGSLFKTGSEPIGIAVCRVTGGTCIPTPL